MNSDVSDIEAKAKRYFPNGPEKLSRDHVQKELTLDFIAALMNRGNKTVDEITEAFGVECQGMLAWLGDTWSPHVSSKSSLSHIDRRAY